MATLVPLGEHIAGDYLPFGAAIKTFYLLLPLVLAEPGEGQRVKAPLKFHFIAVSLQAEN